MPLILGSEGLNAMCCSNSNHRFSNWNYPVVYLLLFCKAFLCFPQERRNRIPDAISGKETKTMV